jgi:hypothetical protein
MTMSSFLPTLLLAVTLTTVTVTANKPPLNAKFCLDSKCSKDCVTWSAQNGVCAPGFASNSYVSSIMTYTTVESGDKAVWQWYGDNATSLVCAESNRLPTCVATLTIEQGDCTLVDMCNGTVKGYYKLQGQPEDWVIAIIVIFGGVVPCCCICACVYFCCCRPGGCCNKSKPNPITYGGDGSMGGARIPQVEMMFNQQQQMQQQQMQHMQIASAYGGQYNVQNGGGMNQPMPLMNYYVGAGGAVLVPQTYPQQQQYVLQQQQLQQQQPQYYAPPTAVGGTT